MKKNTRVWVVVILSLILVAGIVAASMKIFTSTEEEPTGSEMNISTQSDNQEPLPQFQDSSEPSEPSDPASVSEKPIPAEDMTDANNSNESSSTAVKTARPDNSSIIDGYEYFQDNGFLTGIKLHPVDTSKKPVVVNFINDDVMMPFWSVRQWWSRFEITDAELKKSEDGLKYYKDDGKLFGMFQNQGANALRLEVYGEKEYLSPRKNGEAWPSLLLECDFTKITAKKIASFERLVYSMDVRINYAENKMGKDFNSSMHTGQTTAYFTVQNLNRESKGYGDYIWFGIPIFDARYEFPTAFHMQDGGKADATDKLIYVMGGPEFLRTYYDKNPKDKEWAHCQINILEHIKAALKVAHLNGFMKDTTYEDMRIGAFNIGWEIQGTFNCSMDIKNISLMGK